MKVIYNPGSMNFGGFKPGQLTVYASGRQFGKSMLNQCFGTMTTAPVKFSITAKAEVDGATWYTVSCSQEVSAWLRNQHKEWYYEALAHGVHLSQFDIHEKLYTMLALKWS